MTLLCVIFGWLIVVYFLIIFSSSKYAGYVAPFFISGFTSAEATYLGATVRAAVHAASVSVKTFL